MSEQRTGERAIMPQVHETAHHRIALVLLFHGAFEALALLAQLIVAILDIATHAGYVMLHALLGVILVSLHGIAHRTSGEHCIDFVQHETHHHSANGKRKQQPMMILMVVRINIVNLTAQVVQAIISWRTRQIGLTLVIVAQQCFDQTNLVAVLFEIAQSVCTAIARPALFDLVIIGALKRFTLTMTCHLVSKFARVCKRKLVEDAHVVESTRVRLVIHIVAAQPWFVEIATVDEFLDVGSRSLWREFVSAVLGGYDGGHSRFTHSQRM
mmetsp:Transcript_40882/g.67214  ORF Transcript_40882/g.67214 Transcript_40882/m.67214 type:complete len:269 (-) Transcript_40882:143-949(-)